MPAPDSPCDPENSSCYMGLPFHELQLCRQEAHSPPPLGPSCTMVNDQLAVSTLLSRYMLGIRRVGRYRVHPVAPQGPGGMRGSRGHLRSTNPCQAREQMENTPLQLCFACLTWRIRQGLRLGRQRQAIRRFYDASCRMSGRPCTILRRGRDIIRKKERKKDNAGRRDLRNQGAQ
jgi:hypothetical protein